MNPAAAEATAFAHEWYFAIVTLSEPYYDAAEPQPAPSPATTYSPCYSGSGKCN